jgi:hypothetical protein
VQCLKGYRPYSKGECWCRGGARGGHFVKPEGIVFSKKGRALCMLHRKFVRSHAVYSVEVQREKRRKQRERDNGTV